MLPPWRKGFPESPTIRWRSGSGRTLDARVMFVDREGKLLGDSQKDAGEIPLHRHPEVRRALEQSPEQPIPYVKDGQIHVVSPVVRGAGEAGAVLIVYDPEKEKTSLRQVGYSLVGGLAVAYILAAYASSRLANRLTSPSRRSPRWPSISPRSSFTAG